MRRRAAISAPTGRRGEPITRIADWRASPQAPPRRGARACGSANRRAPAGVSPRQARSVGRVGLRDNPGYRLERWSGATATADAPLQTGDSWQVTVYRGGVGAAPHAVGGLYVQERTFPASCWSTRIARM
jgi:hypothetical protein